MKTPPMRFWIGVMIFFTTFTNYMLRSNMSVSIINMVDRAALNHTVPCTRNGNATAEDSYGKLDVRKFAWDEIQVGYIIAAYFWGYMTTIIPAGILSETLGAFHIILWSTALSAVLTGLTPLSTSGGVVGVIINRFCVGMLGAVANPAVNVLISKWAPPKERGRFLAAMMGNTVGTVVTFIVIGWASTVLGWEWGFYIVVIVLCVFCIFFFFVVADTPAKSRCTSLAERSFIEEAHEQHPSRVLVVPPYISIFTSFAVWALCFAQFGSLWGINLIITYAPKLLAEIMGFSLEMSAIIAALPFIARLICSNSFGFIGGKMKKQEVMSATILRKFFVIFSHYLPAVCFFLLRLTGCNHIAVVALLVLNQGFNGAVVVGHLINPQDLSPNFSGTLYGIQNFIGGTTGMFVPVLTGYLNNNELEGAVLIFTIAGGVLAICGTIFIVLGSSKVQSWNEFKDEEGTT